LKTDVIQIMAVCSQTIGLYRSLLSHVVERTAYI